MNQLIHSKQWSPSVWSGMSPRWNSLWNEIDRIGGQARQSNPYLALDIAETQKAYHVSADLPGIPKDNLSVSIEDGVLTISAESSDNVEQSSGRFIRRERFQGKLVRSLKLSDIADQAKIEAKYKDGVLHVEIPKVESAQPRTIEVSVQ